MCIACRVNSFCCGCSLRTGSLIIAIIDLISACTVLIYAIILITENGRTDDWDRNDRPFSRLFFSDDRRILSAPEFFFQGLLYVLAVVSSIVIITDIVLFIGILGGRYKMIGTWVACAFLTSFPTLGGIVGITVAYINMDDPRKGYLQIIIFALFYFGFKVYFMMVVGSYANTLVGEANYYNGMNMAIYPSTSPQVYSNGLQPLYPNVNEQNTVDPNGRLPNPSAQPQMYPNGQPPSSSGQEQVYSNGQPPPYPMYPSNQQTYPNNQIPCSSDQPPPYSIGQPQMPLPPMSEIKRDL